MSSDIVRDAVKNTIEKYNLIEPGDVVILGLSGGPDSVCLFNVLVELSGEMDFTLHGAHLNHMFRPGAAEEDQLYAENMCESAGVCCWSTAVDCPQMAEELGMTSEEAGRKARYDFFAEITESLVFDGADRDKIKVAVAQNLDDHVETVLFRMIRGTGTDGLAGIDYIRVNENGNTVIRPLLDVKKKDILAYCDENRLEPRMDHTNELPVYSRNKIRLELIPYLEENFNANIKDMVNRLSQISRDDRDFIWEQVNRDYEKLLVRKEDNEIWLDKNGLMGRLPSVRHRIIMKAFSEVGLPSDITNAHLKQADELIMNGVTPQRADFPKGYLMRISYDNVICGKNPFEKGENEHRAMPKLIVNELDIDQYEKRPGTAAFDLDQMEAAYGRAGMKEMIEIRTRMPGDYIRLAGVQGRKKIQDLFVDMKIPAQERDMIPLVGIGNEILWIPAVSQRGRYSASYRMNQDTKRVITVEISDFL